MKKFLPLSVALVALLFLATCEREWSNPFDPNNTLDPEAWAPQNLQIETTSITERKLTWTYNGPATIQGFKIDRKKGDEAWQVALAALPKETRTWNDTALIPQTGLTYQYRLYTYAGNNSSAEKAVTTQTDFPAPSELTITKLSDISYKLEWKDNSTGEQGFKIDRKSIENEWVIGYGKVGTDETAFVDTNVFVGKSTFNVEYRVYAFYNETESAKIDANTIAALTPPTDLTITQNTISSVTLNWQDNSTGEEGFKIERKYEGGDWSLLATATTNNFLDDDFKLNSQVYYRVSAISGNYTSDWIENDFDAAIPPPTNLQLQVNSQSSVSLSWSYNGAGHQGFKIDRKTNEGEWQDVFAILPPAQTGFNDNTVNLQENLYIYRVYSYLLNYNSAKVEKYISKPTVTTGSISNITAHSATGGGNVTDDGGSPVTQRGVCWSTSPNPTIANQTTNNGSGSGSFTSNLTDLSAGTTYFVRAYAINLAGTAYGNSIPFTTSTAPCYPFYDSRDGNYYTTVQIGNQCWMKENLKWLPSVSPSSSGSYTSAYFYVNGYQGTSVSEAKATSNYQTYGVLYNWPATSNACPNEWHLPSDNEWTVLIDYLGGNSVAGGKMKTTGTTHWSSPNTGATNSSGFSGLPGGFRFSSGIFATPGGNGDWWSSTEYSSADAWGRALDFNYAIAYRYYSIKELGFSVRCVKD